MAEQTPQSLVHPLVAGLRAGMDTGAPVERRLALNMTAPEVDPDEAGKFGVAAGSEEVRVFVGYLGGRVCRDPDAADKEYWRVLFYDANLSEWLLVREEDVVYTRRVDDPSAPEGKRDYLWVRADARLAQGSSTKSPEALFMSGDFTRAGDFANTLRGDTMSSSTGLFCEARTPLCCGANSRRKG